MNNRLRVWGRQVRGPAGSRDTARRGLALGGVGLQEAIEMGSWSYMVWKLAEQTASGGKTPTAGMPATACPAQAPPTSPLPLQQAKAGPWVLGQGQIAGQGRLGRGRSRRERGSPNMPRLHLPPGR